MGHWTDPVVRDANVAANRQAEFGALFLASLVHTHTTVEGRLAPLPVSIAAAIFAGCWTTARYDRMPYCSSCASATTVDTWVGVLG